MKAHQVKRNFQHEKWIDEKQRIKPIYHILSWRNIILDTIKTINIRYFHNEISQHPWAGLFTYL